MSTDRCVTHVHGLSAQPNNGMDRSDHPYEVVTGFEAELLCLAFKLDLAVESASDKLSLIGSIDEHIGA